MAIGVNMDGERDVLGLWMGPSGGEGAKQCTTMLTELRNRGVLDVLITCCDGLKGLPDAVRTVWPDTPVQTCVVHLVRNSLRFVSKKHSECGGGNNRADPDKFEQIHHAQALSPRVPRGRDSGRSKPRARCPYQGH